MGRLNIKMAEVMTNMSMMVKPMKKQLMLLRIEGQLKTHKDRQFPMMPMKPSTEMVIPCTISSKIASGTRVRNGTCFTEDECAKKNGIDAGSCASNFGKCCVFIVKSGNVVQNNTYIQNPGFPMGYADVAPVAYTVRKVSRDVSYIRLDFETMATLGPADETGGGACVDTLMITVPSGAIPTICGSNTGQHMYLDIGRDADATAQLAFASNGVSTMRMWDIKVTQYKFTSPNRPPPGCLQYFQGMTGRIRSFNFESATSHLANQDYAVCIQQEPGFSCIQYQVCGNEPNGFTWDTAIATSKHDAACTTDFIEINGATALCGQGNLKSRFCGLKLNAIDAATTNAPVCGLCLDYKQVP
eukprot:maker-scaffold138_size318692-snap-gene-1.20 protein:Tk02749 transcript:maker-scaffold138_size318692-snap-gene-1.20-mRNA-1 annotation:"PREDICTED: uncharacterized protein LOC102677823"